MATSNNVTKTLGCSSQDFCSLARVLGIGSKNNFSITLNDVNGLIAWVAGPFVVFYDIKVDNQVSFLKNSNNKIISSVTFSKNGKFLATGEGKCKNGEISIYEINYDTETNVESHSLYCSFKNHKYGIDKIRFFKNDDYLISIGNKEDKTINIFNIATKTNLCTIQYRRQIYGFDICDRFMVLCGDKFIKIYVIEKLIKNNDLGKDGIDKKYVDLSKLQSQNFVGTVIYQDKASNKVKIFFITHQCFLVEMNSSSFILSRWVGLKGEKGFSITLFNNLIACGCANGILRIFNADTLQFVSNLHKPPPLGKGNVESNSDKVNLPVQKDEEFSDVIGVLYSNYYEKLLSLYSDKSYFIWEIKNFNQLFVYRYNAFHSGSILSMDFNIDPKENLVKVATAGDDKTVIYWNMKLSDFIENNVNKKNEHIAYSKYIRHIFYFGKDVKHFKMSDEQFLERNEFDNNTNEDGLTSLSSVKFSPDGKYLVVGDNLGNIFVFSLKNFEVVQTIPAFNGIVNTIDMIYDQENKRGYLGTGGSDGILLVINTSDGLESDLDFYNPDRNFVEQLGCSIISVVFCIDKNKNMKVITGEVDSTINFFLINNSNLQNIQKFSEPDLKTYCLSYCPGIKKIVSGHNGQIKIWKTSTCILHKHFQVCKGDKLLDNFRIAIDSTGVMFATSNNDKNIRVRALHDGKILVRIPIAESISSLSFAMDNSYLIATSVEGYVYFFKISRDFVSKLKTDNALVNSTDDNRILRNKLNLLKLLMENDNNLSKNEQVKLLLQKLDKSEELTMDDCKILDSCIKDKTQQMKEAKKELSKEAIQLKEEKGNNNDDLENENNQNENEKGELTRSHIFETRCKDKSGNITGKSVILSSQRESLATTFSKIRQSEDKKEAYTRISSNDEGKSSERIKIPKIVRINKDSTEKDKSKEDKKENEAIEKNEETLPQNMNKDIKDDLQNEKPIKQEDINLLIQDKIKSDGEKVVEKNNTPSKKQVNEIQEIIQQANNIVINTQNKINEDEEQKKKSLNNFPAPESKKVETNLKLNCFSMNEEEHNLDIININNLKYKPKNFIEEEIKEEIENESVRDTSSHFVIQDSFARQAFTGNIIENSQSQVNQSYMKKMIITQSNFDLCSNNTNLKDLAYEISHENKFNLIAPKKPKVILQKESTNVLSLKCTKSEKDKLNEALQINLNNLNNISDLKELESNLEHVLYKVRSKINNDKNSEKDPIMEKMLDKYSMLLLNRIESLSNKK